MIDGAIEGTYELLEKCGGAADSLHKRVKDSGGNPVNPNSVGQQGAQGEHQGEGGGGGSTNPNSTPAYFFLDPTRCFGGDRDPFVFASDFR